MKTKREILLDFAKRSTCGGEICDECPYRTNCLNGKDVLCTLVRIGAKAILRMFPEKREFDPNKILTCVTAAKAKVGMKGYFADDLTGLKTAFENNTLYRLLGVYEENCTFRFKSEGIEYALFYPIEEVEG